MYGKDIEVGAFFTTNGKDIWKLVSYFVGPSCKLKNVETGKEEHFGIEGFTAKQFIRIEMPKFEPVGEPPVFVGINEKLNV